MIMKMLKLFFDFFILLLIVCVFLATFKNAFGAAKVDARDLFFSALERKRSGKNPSSAERASRKRVQDAMASSSLTTRQKYLFLNNELSRVSDSIFVSREWKDEISANALALMNQNGLKMNDAS